jgi:hypothetical protein
LWKRKVAIHKFKEVPGDGGGADRFLFPYYASEKREEEKDGEQLSNCQSSLGRKGMEKDGLPLGAIDDQKLIPKELQDFPGRQVGSRDEDWDPLKVMAQFNLVGKGAEPLGVTNEEKAPRTGGRGGKGAVIHVEEAGTLVRRNDIPSA